MNMKCKYPESACGHMTLFHGDVYCDSTYCVLHEEPPMPTNADRIRAMSDEELASFLENAMFDSDEPRAVEILHWLQQPVEEAGHGQA